MMHAHLRLSCLLCASLSLTACAPMLAIIGYSQPAVQIVAQIERFKLVGDGVSYVGSGKTITDHALSAVTGADCRIFNVVSPDPVCAIAPVVKATDSRVKISLGPATDQLPQPAVQTAAENVLENSATESALFADGD